MACESIEIQMNIALVVLSILHTIQLTVRIMDFTDDSDDADSKFGEGEKIGVNVYYR
jgi:hypothetical protein